MCTNPDLPWKDEDGKVEESYDYNLLTARIKRLKKRVRLNEPIILTGGEPTLHPRFLDIFEFVQKTFPKNEIRILTNGRRFAYKDFAREILRVKNLNIAVSLCGPNAKIHDGITRTKNSFDQTIKGMENILSLKKKNQAIEIRTVLSKMSYKYIGETLELIRAKFPSIDQVIVIYLEIEGQAEKNLGKTWIKYSKIKPCLEGIYPFFSLLKEIRLYHFPLCTLDYSLWPFVWRTLPEKEITFIKSCDRCNYKKYCLGIHRGYPDKTEKEFRPIRDKISIEESDNFYHPIIKVSRDTLIN